jgi:hypothetical protein
MLILLAAPALPGSASPSTCTYEEEYVFGQRWTFVCETGWETVIVHAVEEIGYEPCFTVREIDPYTIEVTMTTLCLNTYTMVIETSIKGTLFVSQG